MIEKALIPVATSLRSKLLPSERVKEKSLYGQSILYYQI